MRLPEENGDGRLRRFVEVELRRRGVRERRHAAPTRSSRRESTRPESK